MHDRVNVGLMRGNALFHKRVGMRLNLCPSRAPSLLVASETTRCIAYTMSNSMERNPPRRLNERSHLTSFLQPVFPDGPVSESSTIMIEPLFEDLPNAEEWCNFLCPKIYLTLLILVLVAVLLVVIILSSR